MVKPNYKMWVLSECSFCQKASTFFLENNLSHEVVVLDRNQELLNEIKKKYNWETVPIIVKQSEENETFIGGYTDLIAHLNE